MQRFLRLCDVKERVGLSKSTIYRKVDLGEFPAPVKIGFRAVAWTSDSIDEWMTGVIAASNSDDGISESHATYSLSILEL